MGADSKTTRQSTFVEPISIQPRNVYGLRTDIKGNINFTIKQEVIYPVAAVITIHDYVSNKQKFLHFPDEAIVDIITISPNRKLLATSEKYHGHRSKSSINIYDLAGLRKRKTLDLPNDVPIPQAESISFLNDSKGMAVLSKEPDAFLIIYYSDKMHTVLTTRISNGNHKSLTANYMACNPHDTGIIAVAGNFTFKILSRQERGFTLMGTLTGKNKIVTSIAWLTTDILLAGTSENSLLVVYNGNLKMKAIADTITSIDLHKIKEAGNVDDDGENDKNVHQSQKTNSHDHGIRHDVNCLTCFSKGFVFAMHNVLHVFENNGHSLYHKKTLIIIEMTLYAEPLYRIVNVAINPRMDTVLVTTKHNQIYISPLFVMETLQIMELKFTTLGQHNHIDGIIDMSICLWKPIVMTASKDQTIRIWNYKTGQVELIKKYAVAVTVISLHPSGLFVAVGFSDQLRLMAIFLNDLKLITSFKYPRCKQVLFTNKGNMLACAYDNKITILSVFSFAVLRELKGHIGQIQSIVWSEDDHIFVSSDDTGAVYKWNMLTGSRIAECVLNGMIFNFLALTDDASSCYAVSQNGMLREIIDMDVVRKIHVSETTLHTVALAKSNLIMFIGGENGLLCNVQLPFIGNTGGGACTYFPFFNKAVTRALITPGDTLLITGSDDGTLVIWSILNTNGRTIPVNPELGKCEEIMITRDDLIEKNTTITTLELRIAQQIEDFRSQLSQGNAFHSEQLRDIHTEYNVAIEDLKKKNETMEANHVEELNIITENIAKLKDDHSKALFDLEVEFESKLIKELEKSAMVKQKMDEMRLDYEEKLLKAANCLQETSDALEEDFKSQLNEREQLIRDLVKEMQSKEDDFKESSAKIDMDNDRKLVELKLTFENRLKDEREEIIKWRTDAGSLSKKHQTLSKFCDELEREKDTLRIEYFKQQDIIKGLRKDLEKFHEDLEENDRTIKSKDQRIADLQNRNAELEIVKSELNSQIDALNGQIEPRQEQINEKKDQIVHMELEMENLVQNKEKLELQLTEFKDKYNGLEIELKTERQQGENICGQIFYIARDIYIVSGKLKDPDALKLAVVDLYHKYANDAALEKTYEKQLEVEKEYKYERNFLERLIDGTKVKESNIKHAKGVNRLMKENIILLSELNGLRVTLKEVQGRNSQMESLVGKFGKYIPAIEARQKLAKACMHFDEVERNNTEEYKGLECLIQSLTQENQILRDKIFILDK